jgi:hypothetical protein
LRRRGWSYAQHANLVVAAIQVIIIIIIEPRARRGRGCGDPVQDQVT